MLIKRTNLKSKGIFLRQVIGPLFSEKEAWDIVLLGDGFSRHALIDERVKIYAGNN